MRLLLGMMLMVSSPAWANSTCYLSDTGKTKFSQMNLKFCDTETCIDFIRLNGKKGEEMFKFAGCGGRYCLYESKSFNLVFPASGRGTEYVGSRDGNEVYLICPPR